MTRQKRITFGQAIAKARQEIQLTLREAASLIKKENGQPISYQYLSDLERDRRSPPTGHLIEEIARVYRISPAYLFLKAHRLPSDIDPDNERQANAALQALREKLKAQIAA